MKDLDKKIVVIAALLGALTIGIGAFGAHGLKQLVSESSLTTFETGVRYQMYHVFALLILGFVSPIPEKTKKWVSRFFFSGMLFFSGSLYLLSLGEVLPFNTKFLGPVTPIGGLLFIGGWIRLAFGLNSLNK